MDEKYQSKDRIKLYGEVNTSCKEVGLMLDLVKRETERLDSRFLEPACGDGNFLIEVLNRKLDILIKNYKKNQYEFEKNSIVMIGSIYGIDILEDNSQDTRNRLHERFIDVYKKYYKKNINDDIIKSTRFILEKNIIHGDAISFKKVNSNDPITFCEWAVVNNKLKRRDFTLLNLIAPRPFDKDTLFSDQGDEVILSTPINEYPLVDFYKVYETC